MTGPAGESALAEPGRPQRSLPDFFIVGAPKCGTTSLAYYLRQHPGVFIPGRKEPHYFGKDLNGWRPFSGVEEYLALFEDAGGRLCGEASTWYLYSHSAAEEIHDHNPQARIIVMVRDPVDVIASLHNQLLHDGYHEDLEDLAAALAAEPDRRAGRRIPASCRRPEALQYTEVVRFAPQIRRYHETFGADRVHVVVFDDLRTRTLGVYRAVLDFLSVDTAFVPDLEIRNRSKRTRSRRLHAAMRSPVMRRLARVAPESTRTTVRNTVQRVNTQFAPRAPLDRAVEMRLRDRLAPEVRALEELLDRDLSAWLTRRPRE